MPIFLTFYFIFIFLLGILKSSGQIDNAASIKRIAEVALGYAKAGMFLRKP